jgi:TRAP transporter 4TM/12TM fusion protein
MKRSFGSSENIMLPSAVRRFVQIVSLAFVFYQIILPVYAFMPNMKERAIHLAFAIILIFLGGSHIRSRLRWGVDLAFTALGVGLCMYVFFTYREIIQQYGVATSDLQVWMGIILVLIVLESARRMVRPTLPIIASLFLLYALWGHLIPGHFGHPPYSLRTISSMLFLTTGGIWGQLLGVSANIIAIFVFLGAFIVYTGGGTGFMKISLRIAGKYTGGPAKVATISSALFGSVSGSASANVASTGAFTIPMMKRLGYRPAFAGAVEAVASTGGQIMPPIMGAGAFIMAEFTETPYLKIALSATLPALLYFFSIYIGIHFLAQRDQYGRMSSSEIPSWPETMKASVFFLIPFTMLGYWLLRGYTPQYAAFWSVISTLFLGFLNEDYRPDFSNVFHKYRSAVEQGARQAAMIASICASAQVIISVIAFTGLGVKISSNILAFSHTSLFLALVLTGLTSMILGMEVPTTAAYIVAVVVSGPVLIEFGAQPIAAHLFVFYLAILSAVTPPVCGAIFIAAGMAEANWLETAKIGLKLCFAAFFIPFLFVYDPALVLIGSPLQIALAFGRALISIMLVSAGLMGYFNGRLTVVRRLALIGAGILLVVPHIWADIAGLVLAAVFWFYGTDRNLQIPEKQLQS